MKKLLIENWTQHGDYMFFANLVDKTKQWIMLETNANSITAVGKPEALEQYKVLLNEKKIQFKEL